MSHSRSSATTAIPSESGRTYREEFELARTTALRDGRVCLLRRRVRRRAGPLYAGCDIFVAPSRHESFGLILLEAMREGKPVIAGDVGGMREVVEHEGNGLLVPPGDVEALADALRRLVESPAFASDSGVARGSSSRSGSRLLAWPRATSGSARRCSKRRRCTSLAGGCASGPDRRLARGVGGTGACVG